MIAGYPSQAVPLVGPPTVPRPPEVIVTQPDGAAAVTRAAPSQDDLADE